MRKPFIAGNWKMNTDSQSSVSLAKAVAIGCEAIAGKSVDVSVIPPFVYIQAVVKSLNNANMTVGSQDIYFEEKGAFTGEISAAMLKDIGCTYALCGHSERRHVLGETDELVNKKVHAAIKGGLLPILCVGELLEQRQSNQTEKVVSTQTIKGLAGLSKEKALAVTIAYEPVWAIGTGLTATPEQAEEVHKLIRSLLATIYDENTAQEIRILYGGSVKADNSAELMAKENIDGLLVGGASLKSDDFVKIVKSAV